MSGNVVDEQGRNTFTAGLARLSPGSYISKTASEGVDRPGSSGHNSSKFVSGDNGMSSHRSNYKWLWLTTGLVAGISIASIWPHEPLAAATADRNDKFALITCPVTAGSDAVFVLDFLTGRLTGAQMSRTRQGAAFLNFYYRNLAEDFRVGASGEPYYAIASGRAEIPSRGSNQWGSNALFVAELTSGKVAGYAVPFRITQTPLDPVQLVPVDTFPFREATVVE